MKKKLNYEREGYSYFIQGLTKGRIQREYLSIKTINNMLTEFFKACQDVEKQTFDDLKTIYEIREDFDLFLPYKEKYGQ